MNFLLGALYPILVLALAEAGARLWYRVRFGIAFRSKAIAEYPYRSFIERVDPPLEYRFKKGFRSKMVNINRFCCRGPEPAPDGAQKRIMLIGESSFFGVKLSKESQVWSQRLEKILAANGYGDWEVINAGNPTYNSLQHRLLWQQVLSRARPDILLVEVGGNDVSQAWMMGSQWKPGQPWPWKFIMALERKSPWWNSFLSRCCLYFFFRRGLTERKPFVRHDDQIEFDRCLRFVGQNLAAIVDQARSLGARVACMPIAFAYNKQVSPQQARSLEAIQANWKTFVQGRSGYDSGLVEFLRDHLCPGLDIPFFDLEDTLRRHPKRYSLYLDLAHFNAEGMQVVAEYIFTSLDELGWLSREDNDGS